MDALVRGSSGFSRSVGRRVNRGLASGALVAAALAWTAGQAVAQDTGTITGLVTVEATAQPVVSAQLLVQGTTIGTISGPNGRYMILNVPAGRRTVLLERIGYAVVSLEVDVPVGGTAVLNFGLEEVALGLDEIIVTGEAGRSRRREIGNSVAQLNVGDIPEPVVNTEALLQGRVAGLMISQTSAAAGGGAFIRLRGNVSVTQSNFPIIYVDGVRIRSDPYPSNNDRHSRGNASGAAASGLNMINPNDIDRIEVIKGAAATTLYGTEAAAGVIQIFTKSGAGGGDPQWTMQSTITVDHMLKYGTDDFPYMRMKPFLKNAFGQEYNLSVRGGVNDVTYFLSGTFKDDDGVLPNDSEKAYGIRGNLGFQGINNLSIQWNTAITRRDLTNTAQTNSAAGLPLNVYRGDRNYVRSDDPELLMGLLDYELTTRINHFVTGMSFRYQATSQWTHRLVAGYDFSFLEHRNFKPFGFLTDPQGVLQNQRWSNEILTLDYSTAYNMTVRDEITATFTAGGQIVDNEENSTTAWSSTFPGPGRPTVGSGAVQLAEEDRIRVVNAGFFGQVRVGFSDRLFVTGGIRFDGNSAFGSQLGLEAYPKVSVSYVVSESGFWKEAWGQIKLRGAWGRSGRAPGAFDAVKTWAASRYGDTPAFLPQNLGNPDLGPERTSEFELGFDGSWLDQRLSTEVTYYRQLTTDALFPVTLPPSEGNWNAQLANVGTLRNNGVEVTVNATVLRRNKLSLDIGGMLSTNHSEIVSLGGTSQFKMTQGPAYVVEGYPAPVLWGNKVSNPDEIADPVYEKHYYGPNMPTTLFTASTTLRYKDITLSARGEYQGGHWMHSRLEEGDVQRNVKWPPCFDELERGVENMTALERSYCIPSAIKRDYFFRSGDFFKMRDITLQLPIPLVFAGGASPTLTLSARNAFKWTKMEVFDPEMAGQNGSADDVRTIRDNVPPPATFTASVRVIF